MFDDDVADDGMGGEMEGFIEDDESESGRSDDGESRAAAKAKKAKRAKKASGASGGFALAEGLTPEQRDEVLGVFGNGNDFAWAFPDEKEEREDKLEDVSDLTSCFPRHYLIDDDNRTLNRSSIRRKSNREC